MDEKTEEEFESETYLIEITEHCETGILRYFISCLMNAGLDVQVVECLDKNVISVKCPFHELCTQAEEVELLKEVYEDVKVRKFVAHDAAKYKGHEDKSSFFTPAQQILLIEKVLRNVRFSSEEFCKLGMETMDSEMSFLDACSRSKPQLIESHTPKHSDEGKAKVWRSVRSNPFVFPYKDIRNYYGEEVAYYFAWMSYFTYALLPIALFGVALYLHRPEGMTVDDSPYLPFYALFMAFWAILFMKGWTRRESELALEWGTYGIGEVESIRHQFFGVMKKNPITGNMETYYPTWKRRIRYVISFLISIPFLMLGIGTMILSLNLNGYIKYVESPIHISFLAKYAEPGGIFSGDNPYYGWMVPTIAHSIVINVVNKLYRRIALFSTHLENHKTERSWNNSLVVKQVLFELFDCYLPLFYIAFYQLDVMSLRRELVGLFWGDEIRRVVTESVLPFLTEKFEARKLKKNVAALKKTDEDSGAFDIVQNLMYEEYEQFDDYIEMVVQFGYVTLFASAFPLCSIITILFLFLEARSDMFKLLFLCRRPVVKRARSIGVWLNVLAVMVVMAMISNCFLIGFASEQLATWAPEMYETLEDGDQWIKPGYGRYVVGIVFGVEHVLLLIAFLSHMLISDSPKHVSVEIERREYISEEEHKILAHTQVLSQVMASSLDITEEDLVDDDDDACAVSSDTVEKVDSTNSQSSSTSGDESEK